MTAPRHWELGRHPHGWPVPDDVALVEADVPAPGPGEVLVRNHYLSVDPCMRGRMNDATSYAAAYELGRPMHGAASGPAARGDPPRQARGRRAGRLSVLSTQ